MTGHRDRLPHRVLLVAVLVALVVLTLALAAVFGWFLVAATKAVGDEATIRVSTYNANRHRPPAVVRHELVRLSRVSDVILTQETRAAAVGGVPGFTSRVFSGAGHNRPILWRSARFSLVASGTALAQRRPILRAFTWVRLRDRATGRQVTVVNVHGLPHVEVRGHPRALHRVAVYAAALHRLGALLATLPGRLWVGGDWNVGRAADRRIRWPGFPAAWSARRHLACPVDTLGSAGTLGRRTVDYVCTRARPVSVPVRVRVWTGYGSDHRPVTVTYRG